MLDTFKSGEVADGRLKPKHVAGKDQDCQMLSEICSGKVVGFDQVCFALVICQKYDWERLKLKSSKCSKGSWAKRQTLSANYVT